MWLICLACISSSSYSSGLGKEKKQSAGQPLDFPHVTGQLSRSFPCFGPQQAECWWIRSHTGWCWHHAHQHCVQNVLQPGPANSHSGGFLHSCPTFGTHLWSHWKVLDLSNTGSGFIQHYYFFFFSFCVVCAQAWTCESVSKIILICFLALKMRSPKPTQFLHKK